MPSFSPSSKAKLETCHPDLIKVFTEVVKTYDCTVLEGQRSEHDQNEAFDAGRSKLQWPHGKHNKLPSDAVDVAPSPVVWNNDLKNRVRFYHFAGYVKALALAEFGITLRWGGDWDSDNDFKDQSFDDLVHFEIIHK